MSMMAVLFSLKWGRWMLFFSLRNYRRIKEFCLFGPVMHPACRNDCGILQVSKNIGLSGVFQEGVCHISGERALI